MGFCFFPPGYVAFWDSKTSHQTISERVSYCEETSPTPWLPPQDRPPSLTLLSLFFSFVFCPTSFWREWAGFLGAWCPPPVFRSCFVKVAQHSNNLLMNLWWRKCSPCPIPLWSWMVLWRPTRPSRTNTPKRYPLHYRGLECKSRKSRVTWSNRQIWPWSTERSSSKANRVLQRECTGHNKHHLPTTQEKTLHMDITRRSILKSDWLYSLQPKMEILYTVSKNKTGS